ncbi:TPA: hypothetical protein MCM29_005653 [Klebsiella pneumoniae]|nr:hypothetical protein [Klebsiella pneumoniae]
MFIMKSNGKTATPLANSKEINLFYNIGVKGIKDNYSKEEAFRILQRLVDSGYLPEDNY